jgi:hypothetical protein
MLYRGRSAWARLATVVLAVGFVTSALFSASAGPTAGTAEAQGTGFEVSPDVKHDASPRLDSLTPRAPQGTNRPSRRVSPAADRPAQPALRPDPARQSAGRALQPRWRCPRPA